MSTGSEARAPEAPPQEENPLPKEGDVLAGKYLIDRVLGQGGMGIVVAAHHTTLRQRVAVKFLLPEAAKRAEATERFLREARAAVAIQSEHVARVMDVGTLDNGSPYMVMELLSGSDLGVILKDRGTLPVEQAVDYILQACEAIAEAHSIGIIHRDLKPANLFLSQRADGSALVKVLDFGLSKATKPDAMDASLTAANVVMGSPFYMSPEQIRSLKGIDQRSDIWSLGVILYQLLTGMRPFEGESLGGLFLMIGADPAAPPRSHRPDLPEELDAAIMRCLEKDPARRPQTVAELARLIAPFGPEDGRVSVERIHRVLADATPIARRSSLTNESSATGMSLDPATRAAIGSAPSVPPAGPSTVPAVSGITAVAAVSGAALASPGDPAKSGSIAAVLTEGPETQSSANLAPKKRGTAVVAIAGFAVLAIAGVAVIGLKGSKTGVPAVASSAGPAIGAATSITTGPQPPAETHPTATATAAATEAPTAATATPEPTATATAHATAEPSASAKAGKASKGGKTGPKKNKDPLDRWR